MDDDVASLQLLESILADDFDLRLAASATEAIEVVKQFHPDLVLLDIMLPDMSGYEACKRIRRDDALRDTKVVLVSGRSQIDDRLRGYEAGADDFITKPYNPDELAAKVRVVLRLKRAEEVNRLKDDVLTLLAHETRTPLTVIRGALDALRELGTPDSAPGTQFLDMIGNAAHRLGRLMERSHLFCSLKSGSVVPNLGQIDLRVLLHSIVGAMEDSARERGARIEVTCDGGCEAVADGTLFGVAISSVVENAIRFSPEGSVVSVRTSHRSGTVMVTVDDNGPGFDADVIPHLFEELSTHGITHHHEGARLGLAISHEIMELHGGSIRVGSRDGGGCSVTLTLPALSPAATAAAAADRKAGE